ncbi:molybdopterin oxidoreductase family protein [Novosphingobium taihuense]|uniref:Anaerobic selenocysteine-containing dehydrogenase n=1 Tax=Novosphingobium taihuense TaxID=260085 RepID=A0A7W7AA06_9SPHN|nr:molybdopterin oxidoreductase family protein [Novosphingobium taihuense]MBB4613164.1 anaerobic selenocysteine-containing dehydrogenase [Novosphingobium taihuense]TWH85305.1 anaerobic selenocysteine-containing dehydrogenase [Novosphingobium taihuense]
MPQVRKRTCHICEANCGVLVEVEGTRILSIKGDADNPLSRGHICPKGTALQDLQEDPDRLRKPLKRVGSDWQEISFEQAFAEIGEKVRAILARDPDSSAVYIGNPNAHSYGNALNAGFLEKALRTRTKFSASTVDQMPNHVANLRLWGHASMFPIPDADRTQTLVILGGNPMASNGSLWTVPDFRNRMKDLRARGGELVVIDPRRTETAKIADRHLFIRPASDVFFLVALLKAVMARKPHRPVQDFVTGLDEVAALLERFDSEACAQASAVPLAEIERLADRFAAGPAALYGRMGTATQANGTLNAWLISLINIASGQLDREGGWVFGLPAVDTVNALPPGSIGKYSSRVSGHRSVLGEFPAAAMAEEIETPGQGQIKALFVVAGNPVLSTPNGARLAKALESLDLMVSIDIYRNATSAHAHYILPPAGPLERDHYGLFLLPMAARTIAVYSPPTLPQAEGSLHDWEILRGLAHAISGEPVQAPTPREALDGLLQAGPYGLTLQEVEAVPSGIDLGPPPVGQLPARLRSASKSVPCAIPEFMVCLEELEVPNSEVSEGLRLIGRRHLRTNNSWLANSRRLIKGPDRCTVMINPTDAEQRGIADGATVKVRSSAGEISLSAEVTDDMMPGTVSIPHGWGHALPGVAMANALGKPGVSVNDITLNEVDPLSGNAALSGIAVEVEVA